MMRNWPPALDLTLGSITPFKPGFSPLVPLIKKRLPLQRRRLSARVRCVRSSGWGGGFRLKTHSCTSPHHGEEAARNAGRAAVILPWEVCCICFWWPVESRSALRVLRDASISLRRAVIPPPPLWVRGWSSCCGISSRASFSSLSSPIVKYFYPTPSSSSRPPHQHLHPPSHPHPHL